MVRWHALLLALLFSFSAFAAPPPARDAPVRVGFWYDRERLGSGFDVQVAGDGLFVVWYTYRADGSSVWYTAQAPMDARGEFDAPLLRHRWQDGYAGNVAVGRLRLTRNSATAMRALFTVDGTSGELAIVPLVSAPVATPIDRTGTYFEPARPGYGMSLAEQGPLLIAAYYAYDASGEPTWLFGSNGSLASMPLVRYRGACPSCAFAPSTAAGNVAVQLTLDGETRVLLSVDDAAALLPAAFSARDVVLRMLTEPASARPRNRGLVAFAEADAFERFMERALLDPPRYQPPGLFHSGILPTQPFFRTDVEQFGDAPDSVVRDGDYVYAFDATADGSPVDAVRVVRLDAALPGVTVAGSVATSSVAPVGDRRRLLIGPAHLVAVTSREDAMTAAGALDYSTPNIGVTDVQVFDRRSPEAPRPLWRARFDGNLVTARRAGDDLLLVLRSAPPVGEYRFDILQTRALNTALLAATPAEQLLPRVAVGDGDARPLLAPTDVFLPPTTTRVPSAEYLTFVRVALDDVADREALAIAGGVETVHAGRESGDVYVLTTPDEPSRVFNRFAWPGYSTTDVHRVGVRAGRLALLGTGVVEGQVGRHVPRPSTRVDEHGGRVRVVTLVPDGRLGRARVTVLEPTVQAPWVLRTVAAAPNLEQPQPLRVDDSWGMSFVGSRLLALGDVVDLAAASGPRIVPHALPRVPQHLTDLGGGLLLGVGIHNGTSVFVSLFDARVPDALRVLDTELVGQQFSASAVLEDPHALAVLPVDATTTRVALPIVVFGQPEPPDDRFVFPRPGFTHRALYAFEITGAGAAARFARREALVGAGFRTGPNPVVDRALLTPAGAVFYAEGRFFTAPYGAFAAPSGPH